MMVKIILFFVIIIDFHFAYSNGVSEICGQSPIGLSRFINQAEKAHLKCLEDFYNQKKEEANTLAVQISESIQKQKIVVKKSAFKTDNIVSIVHCDFPKNILNYRSKSEQCLKEAALLTGLITQLDDIMGWKKSLALKSVKSINPTEIEQALSLPCPDEETLKKIQPVRHFRRDLYKVYEQCKILVY